MRLLRLVRCAFSLGLSALLRLLSGLPTNNKLLLYKNIVRPIVTYAVLDWYPHTSKTTRTAQEVFQNRTLRQLIKTSWFIRNTVVQGYQPCMTLSQTRR
ncbi:hypothetical protein J6590_014547 [Homalodisca vitripennis]|nr:hypothetical protein J6590_014547 [Homalodisca vitripennis]